MLNSSHSDAHRDVRRAGVGERTFNAEAAGPAVDDLAAVLVKSVREQRHRLRQIAKEMSTLSLPWLLE